MTILANKDLFRPDEAKEYFSVTRQTIYLWVDNGILDGVKVEGSSLLWITRESIERCQKKLNIVVLIF